MKLMEFGTSFGSQQGQVTSTSTISMITRRRDRTLSTTIWLMGGLEQAVEGRIDVIAGRLVAVGRTMTDIRYPPLRFKAVETPSPSGQGAHPRFRLSANLPASRDAMLTFLDEHFPLVGKAGWMCPFRGADPLVRVETRAKVDEWINVPMD